MEFIENKKIHYFLVFLAILAFVALPVSGLGIRADLWQYGTGFTIMRWTFYFAAGIASLALILLVISIIAKSPLVMKRSVLLIAITIFPLIYIFYQWYIAWFVIPSIHDITTDWQDVPEFVDVVPLRVNARNSLEYSDVKVTKQQLEYYPYIKPIQSSLSVNKAFDQSLQLVHDLSWELVGTSKQDGRIEATETTFWYRFKDDVVIRIRPAEGGSRIDLRSISRIGGSDVGANAARIKKFIDNFSD